EIPRGLFSPSITDVPRITEASEATEKTVRTEQRRNGDQTELTADSQVMREWGRRPSADAWGESQSRKQARNPFQAAFVFVTDSRPIARFRARPTRAGTCRHRRASV